MEGKGIGMEKEILRREDYAIRWRKQEKTDQIAKTSLFKTRKRLGNAKGRPANINMPAFFLGRIASYYGRFLFLASKQRQYLSTYLRGEQKEGVGKDQVKDFLIAAIIARPFEENISR